MSLGTFTGLACKRYILRFHASVTRFQDGQFDAAFFLHQSPEVLLSTVLHLLLSSIQLGPRDFSSFYAQIAGSAREECILAGQIVDLIEDVAVSLWKMGKELLCERNAWDRAYAGALVPHRTHMCRRRNGYGGLDVHLAF